MENNTIHEGLTKLKTNKNTYETPYKVSYLIKIKCPICKNFIQKKNLPRHLQKIHNETLIIEGEKNEGLL